GGACESGAECTSGSCVDGVCCDSACDNACESCGLPGALGTCSLVPVGTTPEPACGGDLLCDGVSRGCPGSCLIDGTPEQRDAMCPADFWCDSAGDGECEPVRPKGASCGRGAECESGSCVHGVCCDSDCDGGCARCDLPA